MTGECKSYQRDSLTCAAGFVQMPLCSGRGGCYACGHVADKHVPYCMRDEVPEHMVKDDGYPRFYTQPNTK